MNTSTLFVSANPLLSTPVNHPTTLGLTPACGAQDDCWSASTRDAQGNLQADPKKFPNGLKVCTVGYRVFVRPTDFADLMQAVADYVHSKNLKFGV